MGPPRCFSVAVLLAGLLVTVSACSGDGSPVATRSKTSSVGATGASSSSSSSGPGSRIVQPRVPHGVRVAPSSARVDTRVPVFSHPTEVTNPLFPVSRQASVVFVGHVDGQPFRTEVTLLPTTRIIDWGGQRIETLVSQYTAYLDGRLQEVAYDLYAQADDGSVWYFGEDVADLAHGDITSKEGTWLAGKDGPAQMIMPGPPHVGDVFRTENIPGVAFEQVTVKSVNERLEGPLGPVVGMVGEELHEDGTTEDKQFAPGYGEFFTRDGPDVEALALAVPTDASPNAEPAGLRRMFAVAEGVLRSRRTSGAADSLARSWASVPRSEVPRLMGPVVARAIRNVRSAADPGSERRAAMDLALRVLDLRLRYRDPVDVNRARVGLWCDLLIADARAGREEDVNGDVFTLFYLRDRVQHALPRAAATAYNHWLGVLQVSAADADLQRARHAAERLGEALAR